MQSGNPNQVGRFVNTALVAAAIVTLSVAGCVAPAPPPRAPLAVPATAASAPAIPENETPAQAAARLSQEMAARVQAAGADGVETVDTPGFDPFAGAEPLPTQRPEGGVAWASPQAPTTRVVPAAAEPISATESEDLAPAPAVAATPAPSPTPRSRAGLVDALVEQLAAETGAALPRAVVAAGLSLAGPDDALDPRLVAGLKPLDREAAERVRDLFVRLRTVADTPGARFDRKTVDTAVAEAFGRQPVSIAHAELCRSVAGYGVYEPLNEGADADRFLAGQGNRAILYIEVEDFVPLKLDDHQREVRLSQELILYKEHDGLAVWQDGPTEVTDVSRNHRRDFFLVHMIELPARLGPGRYRLKVRVTDPHGDTVDETTLRILMVADAELLRGE